jgi:hypothetical protein
VTIAGNEKGGMRETADGARALTLNARGVSIVG